MQTKLTESQHQEIDRRSTSVMASAQETEESRKKKEEIRRKRDEWQLRLSRKSSSEEYWIPNQVKSWYPGWNPHDYFSGGKFWETDKISK